MGLGDYDRGTGREPLGRLRAYLCGTALASAAVGIQVLDRLTPQHPGVELSTIVVSVVQCLALLSAWRNVWWCWWGVLFGTEIAILASFHGVATTPWTLLPVLVALYQVAAVETRPRRPASVVWPCLLGTGQVAVLNIVSGLHAGAPGRVVAGSAVESVVLVPGLLACAWQWGGRLQAARATSAALSAVRTADIRSAVLQERACLAADLHDVAAHHLSCLVMQVEALRSTAAAEGRDALAFDALADTGRQAMDDMRTLLTVLRTRRVGEVMASPSAARTATAAAMLSALPDLVAVAARGGQRVTADLPDDLDGLPTTVSATAYRVVQESLTNARRHAPAASVHIAVRRDPHAVNITVVNKAAPPTGPRLGRRSAGAGLGLAGMRERVGLLGGTLTAGPDACGGWSVITRLPAETSVRNRRPKPFGEEVRAC